MGGVVKTVLKVASVVAAVALAIPSGGTSLLAATLGVSAAAATGIAAGLALGSSLLFRPKAPKTSAASMDRLQANIDPRAPRKFVLGRTAMATDIRDQEFSDDQSRLHRFIVLASHQVAEISELWLDDKLAWTATGGITSEFDSYLGVEGYTLGSAANAKNISPRMGATRRYTGLAYLYLRFKLTGNSKKSESPFAQSVPSRVTIVGKGALCYDPRRDSTVPGGSGSMRANDQSTWAWDDNACRNPAIQLLWYLLGWRIQNPATGEWRLAVGKGIPAARIDIASFITAANLCDEPVTLASGGTQPRYRSDALFSEADATSTVLDQLKAAMNAELDDVDGKIRITVLHNDLATPVASFSEDDVLSGFTWEQTAPLDEMYNVVRGTYIDPSDASLYQSVEFPEVRIPSPDGIDRIETVNFQAVQDARQAQRLAKQRVARMLYSGRFSATFSYRAWKVQKNDVIRLSFAPLGWTNKLFRVVETAVQVDGQVPMVLQVENADIYLWDRDERASVQPVQPTSYDPYLNPVYQDVADPKYDDGTSINDLRPAEPGATDGMSPDEAALLAQLELDTAQALINIAAAEATITQMQTDVAELSADILAAEGAIDTVEATQVTHGAAITTLQTTANTQAGQLATLTTGLSTANANISTAQSAITGLNASVASINSALSSQGSSITTMQTAITTLEGDAAILETQVNAGGGNLLTNTDFAGVPTSAAAGIVPAGWATAAGSGHVVEFQTNGRTVDDKVTGENNLSIWQPNTNPSGFAYWGQEIEVEAGKWYDVSCYAAAHRCDVRLYMNWKDASGDETLGFPNTGNITPATGGKTLDQWTRISFKVQAPAGAVRARFDMRKMATKTGSTSYAWFMRPQVKETKESSASPLAYSPGSGRAMIEQQAQALSTLTTQYASLSTAVSTQGVTITSQQTAITTINGNITTLFGRWGFEIDVNGYVSGMVMNNNGSRADLTFRSDKVRFIPPGGNGSAGKYIVIDGSGRTTDYILSGGVRVVEIGWIN